MRALLVLMVLLSACATRPPVVDIISVDTWGGSAADTARMRPQTITHLTLHHQGEPFPAGTDPVAYLRRLQSWSRATKGWADLPYHYIIDLDGRIYEGRNIGFAGDTNTEYDPIGHALIEVVGNFEEVEPNAAQLASTVRLMGMLVTRYHLPLEAIHGHRDYSQQTVCPGKNLYRYLENGYFREQVGAAIRR
ncbi:MAG: peptidoglycan recognition family protein [Pseudomonadota bacterium]